MGARRGYALRHRDRLSHHYFREYVVASEVFYSGQADITLLPRDIHFAPHTSSRPTSACQREFRNAMSERRSFFGKATNAL